MKLYYTVLRLSMVMGVLALTLLIQMDATATLSQNSNSWAFHGNTVNMFTSIRTETTTPSCGRVGYQSNFSQYFKARVSYTTDDNHPENAS